jgi:hypothetical protein
MAERPPLRWTVVCENFVSVHDDHANAVLHVNTIIRLNTCKSRHTVAQTNLEYGSRHYGLKD